MTMKDVSFSFVVKEIFKVKHKKCRCSLRVAAFLMYARHEFILMGASP